MKRIALVAAIAAIGISTAATAEDTSQPPQAAPQEQQAQQATLVRKVVKRPPRVVHRHRRFHPQAHPTASYVFNVIVPYEASRWGASAGTLTRRISCESHGNWWASNGQYQGVGQFAYGTFARGLRSIQTRAVTMTKIKIRRMHSRVYRHWSDGRITRHSGRIVRQTVVTRLRGVISTSWSDAWTQVRIMAQANRGISNVRDSEWSCR